MFHYYYYHIIIILGLGSTSEREHAIFGLLSLAYTTQHNGLPSIFLITTWIHFSLWLSIPYHKYAKFSLLILHLLNTSTDSTSLATVRRGAINMGVQVSLLLIDLHCLKKNSK
jgi:hypothetical protein